MRMIEEAKRRVSANNAKVLEAYPVEQDSPSYKFMGLQFMFLGQAAVVRQASQSRKAGQRFFEAASRLNKNGMHRIGHQ